MAGAGRLSPRVWCACRLFDDLLGLPLPNPVTMVSETIARVALGAARACYRQGASTCQAIHPAWERPALLASRGIIGNDLTHEVFQCLQDDGKD